MHQSIGAAQMTSHRQHHAKRLLGDRHGVGARVFITAIPL